jgi:hypothetical protein
LAALHNAVNPNNDDIVLFRDNHVDALGARCEIDFATADREAAGLTQWLSMFGNSDY